MVAPNSLLINGDKSGIIAAESLWNFIAAMSYSVSNTLYLLALIASGLNDNDFNPLIASASMPPDILNRLTKPFTNDGVSSTETDASILSPAKYPLASRLRVA